VVNCTRNITALSASQPQGFNMLNGLDTIEGLTAEQIEAVNALATGLINKKEQLEEKLTKVKGSVNKHEGASEELRVLKASMERTKLEEKESYQGALTLQEQEYKASLEKLTNGSNEKDQLIHKLLVDNGLSAELVKLNVNKDLMPLIQQGFSAQATITEGKAMIGEQSLSDFMKEWGETPQGKASRIAQNNSGGDGQGGGNLPTGKKMTEMTGAERTALFQQDPVEFNRLKAEM